MHYYESTMKAHRVHCRERRPCTRFHSTVKAALKTFGPLEANYPPVPLPIIEPQSGGAASRATHRPPRGDRKCGPAMVTEVTRRPVSQSVLTLFTAGPRLLAFFV